MSQTAYASRPANYQIVKGPVSFPARVIPLCNVTIQDPPIAPYNPKHFLTEEALTLIGRVPLKQVLRFVSDTGIQNGAPHVEETKKNDAVPRQVPGLKGQRKTPETAQEMLQLAKEMVSDIWQEYGSDAMDSDTDSDFSLTSASSNTTTVLKSARLDISSMLKAWNLVDCKGLDRLSAEHEGCIERAAREHWMLWHAAYSQSLENNVSDLLCARNPDTRVWALTEARKCLDYRTAVQDTQVECYQKAVRNHFEDKIFTTMPPQYLAGVVFRNEPCSGYDEIAKGYLAWRKIWWTFTMNESIDDQLTKEMKLAKTLVQDVLPCLRMWGNIQNDYTLYRWQEISGESFMDLYGLQPDMIHWLLDNYVEFREECEWLNNYAGLRRNMSLKYYSVAKSAIGRISYALQMAIDHEQIGGKNGSHVQVWKQDAKFRFAELRSALSGRPWGPEDS